MATCMRQSSIANCQRQEIADQTEPYTAVLQEEV